jgi:2'-5' RNA ligase
MRLFVGIPLGDAVVSALSAFTARLRTPDDGLRWSSPAGWHVTLQFLGKTTADQLSCITSALNKIRFEAFKITLNRPGYFDRSGVFFVGVHGLPELLEIQKQVTKATSLCGFTAEERPYHPHITLARAKAGGSGLRHLKEGLDSAEKFPAFTAQEFVVYESFLQPGGSRFEVRERFPLLGSTLKRFN